MKLKLIPILLLLLLAQLLFGQNSTINGRVVNNNHKACVSKALIMLINNEGTISKSKISNACGQFKFDSLTKGEYLIIVNETQSEDSITNKIKVDLFDTLNLLILNHSNCYSGKTINICPICGQNNVILTLPDSTRIIHYQFNNRKSARKYYKKRAELGYETEMDNIWPDLINEIEFLVSIDSVEENRKFKDTCYHWFCKNCKLIY